MPLWLMEGLDILERRGGSVRLTVLVVCLLGILAAWLFPGLVPPTPIVGAAVALAALLLGLAVGIAVDTADLTLRGPRHVRAAGGELVAVVPTELNVAAARPLAAAVLDAREDDGKLILGIAAVGRDGRRASALTDALAIALADFGVSVLRLDLAAGREDRPGLHEVLRGEHRLVQVVDFEADGVPLARLGPGRDLAGALAALPELPARLPRDLDVLLVALPTAASRASVAAATALDHVLLLGERNVTSRVDLLAGLDALESVGLDAQVVLLDDRFQPPTATEPLPIPDPAEPVIPDPDTEPVHPDPERPLEPEPRPVVPEPEPPLPVPQPEGATPSEDAGPDVAGPPARPEPEATGEPAVSPEPEAIPVSAAEPVSDASPEPETVPVAAAEPEPEGVPTPAASRVSPAQPAPEPFRMPASQPEPETASPEPDTALGRRPADEPTAETPARRPPAELPPSGVTLLDGAVPVDHPIRDFRDPAVTIPAPEPVAPAPDPDPEPAPEPEPAPTPTEAPDVTTRLRPVAPAADDDEDDPLRTTAQLAVLIDDLQARDDES
ncbi:hypothetical protein [Egicoccus sp. AB-alg2]|uniref:hypothetical protein n=1 Tax=Egicoccus sp. AB-alg2 TaxID=3242693 RepID=UPI00359D8272